MTGPGDRLGGLYEETGLFCGASAAWGLVPRYQFVRLEDPIEIRRQWQRMVADLVVERHFGHEGLDPRPRLQDTYFAVWRDESLLPGKGCGDGHHIGIAYTQRPDRARIAYGFGLFPECRKQTSGLYVKEALIAECFRDPAIGWVESEVYSSNIWSLRALHGGDDVMTCREIRRQTMLLDGQWFDSHVFEVSRARWQARHPMGTT